MSSLTKQQIKSGSPVGNTDAIVTTQNYLKAIPATPLESCTFSGTSGASTAPLDLESTAGISFPNVSQGSTKMCSSMAFANGYSLKYALQFPKTPVPVLSALFAYYFQRIDECVQSKNKVCSCPDSGSCDPPCVDCGSYLNTAAAVFSTGVCQTTEWSYTMPLNSTPSRAAVQQSTKHKVSSTACVATNAAAISEALDAKHPVIVLINMSSVQMKWMSATVYSVAAALKDVVLPPFNPKSKEETFGHVVMVCGRTADRHFIARNNFGSTWGYQGRFLIPFDQCTDKQLFRCLAVVDVV